MDDGRWTTDGSTRSIVHRPSSIVRHLNPLISYQCTHLILVNHLDVQLIEGLFGHGRRRVGHKVAGLGGLGEGYDLAYAVLPGEEHHNAVYAGSDAAVRRRAVFERGEQVPEAGVGLLFAV